MQSFLPPVYSTLSRVINAGICRTILALLGVVWINVDTIQLRKTGYATPEDAAGEPRAHTNRTCNSRSPPKVPFDPKKGDIIVTNSSSYIDLLFLVFRCATLSLVSRHKVRTGLNCASGRRRYNATLTLPVTSGPASAATAHIIGWRRVSLLRALFASGTLPQQATTAESLNQLVASADGPVVIFPEVRSPSSRRRLRRRLG